MTIVPSTLQADGYAVITPGELPTFVSPDSSGGYSVITPSQLPTFITPK